MLPWYNNVISNIVRIGYEFSKNQEIRKKALLAIF